jgi:hypothetical protein
MGNTPLHIVAQFTDSAEVLALFDHRGPARAARQAVIQSSASHSTPSER